MNRLKNPLKSGAQIGEPRALSQRLLHPHSSQNQSFVAWIMSAMHPQSALFLDMLPPFGIVGEGEWHASLRESEEYSSCVREDIMRSLQKIHKKRSLELRIVEIFETRIEKLSLRNAGVYHRLVVNFSVGQVFSEWPYVILDCVGRSPIWLIKFIGCWRVEFIGESCVSNLWW